MKPVQPSAALSEVVGSKPIPRTEVTKKLWAYIKKNGLQDKKNKRMIKSDDMLKPVFGGKAVSPGHPAPFVHDLRRRELDERGLFTTRDERERSAIIARYHVQWLLLDLKFANDPKNAVLISRGHVVHRDRRFTLVQLH